MQVTIVCADAAVGDSGIVDGVMYTKVDRARLNALAWDQSTWPILETSCTSGVTNMAELFFDQQLLDEEGNYADDVGPFDVEGRFYSFNADISTWDTLDVPNQQEEI